MHHMHQRKACRNNACNPPPCAYDRSERPGCCCRSIYLIQPGLQKSLCTQLVRHLSCIRVRGTVRAQYERRWCSFWDSIGSSHSPGRPTLTSWHGVGSWVHPSSRQECANAGGGSNSMPRRYQYDSIHYRIMSWCPYRQLTTVCF